VAERRTRLSRSLAALVAALCLAALTACGGGSDGEFHGNELDPPFTVPATPLTDTGGEDFSLVDDTDKDLTLVFFGYTHCPDICGQVMSNLATAMTRLDEGDRDRVDVVFVTTDPARDDEATLTRYLDGYDPDFIGLTGDLDTISAIALPLGVGVEKGQRLPSGGYDVTHGTTVTGIDADDHGSVYWNESTSSAEYAADIHTLLAGD
jgi:protein SCO1/2